MDYFFKRPFAESGDTTTPPRDTQIDGSVSFQTGFGADYEGDLDTDPNAKEVPRDTTNALFLLVTAALQELQTHGVPDWITSALNDGAPYPYDIYALVRYDDGTGAKVYRSLVDGNTALPTDPAAWAVLDELDFSTQAQAEAGTNAETVMSPLRTTQNVTARLATQAIAEAGLDALRLMTPFRTAQAITAQTPFVGAIIAGVNASAPSGYLLANGATVSRATYSRLFTVVGTTYGAGDGSTTFTLPDLRGRALVGVDGGRGLDPGRVLGSDQAAQVGGHGHPWYHGTTSQASTVAGATGGLVTTPTGAFALEAAYDGTPSATQGEQIGGGGTGKNRIDNVAVNWFIKY